MPTLYAWVPSPEHEYPDHPERPGRLTELSARLDSFKAERLTFTPATRDEIARVHSAQMIQTVESASAIGPQIIDFAPTYVTPASFDSALLASGAALGLARAIWAGEAANGFALVRPPGHHAEPERAMGFCLFNNIAVAAYDLLARGTQRVLVVDYDAHHGNGTQESFLHDDRLAYLSLHQWGIYPGTGRIEDAPHAKGRIVNVPLPAYAGDESFVQISKQVITPMVEKFRPEIILVSAGFDAHWDDPLTSLGVSTAGFYNISKHLVDLASEHCAGKILFVLEGGYSPRNVAEGACAVFAALTGGRFDDPRDSSPRREADVTGVIESVRAWNGFV